MDNYNLLYNANYITDDETDDDIDNDSNDGSYLEDKPNINKIEYTIKTNFFLISTLDRNWSDKTNSSFSFQVKFNTSNDSLELEKTYSDQFLKLDVTLSRRMFYGSKTLSIPINLKNIVSLHIEKIIVPNRRNYLGNGSFNSTVNFNTLIVKIDEFDNVNYGSNAGLNNCFAAFTGISGFDESLNYTEFVNLSNMGVQFNINPLNNINCLTISITDDQGNLLKYQNETLTVKKIQTDSSYSNYIKITTYEHFSRLNYKEGDILVFKDVIYESDSKLQDYLNQKEGHKLYFSNSHTIPTNLDSIENLHNNFYISKKGTYINNEYKTTEEGITYPAESDTITGNIINKNLQLLFKMKIETKEKNFDFFNPQII